MVITKARWQCVFQGPMIGPFSFCGEIHLPGKLRKGAF